MWHWGHHFQSNSHLLQIASTLYLEILPKEGCGQQISKTSEVQGLHTPQQPLDILLEIHTTICSTKSASASSCHHQAAAPNQLPVSTTRQQHQISFQFLPPGSSTKSASSFYQQAAAPNQVPVSTTRQQHQISFQFLLPGSSTTSASLQQGDQPTSC